jgi:hypothetical protein
MNHTHWHNVEVIIGVTAALMHRRLVAKSHSLFTRNLTRNSLKLTLAFELRKTIK